MEDCFSPDEIDKLLRFCAAMNLDYGELDVLRHKADGRIYVVDVNTTPDGHPLEQMDEPINRESIRRRAEALEALIAARVPG